MNLFDIPANLLSERFDTLLDAPSATVERIVSLGHASAPGFWYEQDRHEWVVLLRGAARLRFEDEEQALELKPGDYLDIPAHRRHRVEWTDPTTPTIWIAVHYGDCTPRNQKR